MQSRGNRFKELRRKKQARSTMILSDDIFSRVSFFKSDLGLISICGFLLSGCYMKTAPHISQTDDGKRVIQFSGFDWWVKQSDRARGPGPNFYTDDDENVWVDDQGRLHMTIKKRDGKWQCTEVVTLKSLGFGKYTFQLDPPVHGLDVNSVIGLFTWSDNPEQNNREIDIEITRWGEPTNHLGQFVVQPYDGKDNMVRFPIPEEVKRASLSFDWGPDDITFEAIGGRFPKAFGKHLHSWTYDGSKNPTPGDENVRVNFWMNRGREPASDDTMEIVIRKFEFEPREE